MKKKQPQIKIIPMPLGRKRKNQFKAHCADDEYELIQREAYPKTMQLHFEARMIGSDVQKRLAKLRKEQRAAGIPDEKFLTPKQRRERGIEARGQYPRRLILVS